MKTIRTGLSAEQHALRELQDDAAVGIITKEQPVITCDITRGVWGSPFQRTREERKAWRELLEPEMDEQGVVAVHCRIQPRFAGTELCIHRSTYLRDRYSGECSRLLHAEHIAHPPLYTRVDQSKILRCTLFFEALPHGCTHFDLEEHTTEPFPFTARNIQRNRLDVYHVTFSENVGSAHSTNNH
jgi:hypothetical protein